MSYLRTIKVSQIRDSVAKLCGQTNFSLPPDVYIAFEKALKSESLSLSREILSRLLENATIAESEKIPICQDCGLALVFLDIGQDVHFVGGNLYEAINEGVRQGYKEFYLRKSVCHPFNRTNTGDNTPAVIHIRIINGNKVYLWLMPKGGGSENMSKVFLLTPSEGINGIKDLVIKTVEKAGPNPCPPIILSVAIGGTFEDASIRAKRALLKELNSINPDPEAAALETSLITSINELGIGPGGLGGKNTCLRVFVDIKPCHIASLPLVINIQCHAARHKKVVL